MGAISTAPPVRLNSGTTRPHPLVVLRSQDQKLLDAIMRNDVSGVIHFGKAANPNAVIDNKGTTMLMAAARSGTQQTIIALVDLGANIFLENKEGLKAFGIATRAGNRAASKALGIAAENAGNTVREIQSSSAEEALRMVKNPHSLMMLARTIVNERGDTGLHSLVARHNGAAAEVYRFHTGYLGRSNSYGVRVEDVINAHWPIIPDLFGPKRDGGLVRPNGSTNGHAHRNGHHAHA